MKKNTPAKMAIAIWDEEYLMFSIIVPEDKAQKIITKIQDMYDKYYGETHDYYEKKYGSYYEYIEKWISKQKYIGQLHILNYKLN